MPASKRLLVIGGPTASGKTALAIKLAQEHQAEIFSADSRQLYKELNIGVAKPSAEELATVPHHFISSHSIHQPYSAGDYEKECLAALEAYFQQHDTAIMVGGTGLFINAVLYGLDEFPDIDPALREALGQRLEKEGLPALAAQLAQLDPKGAQQITLDNPRRVLRALEVCLTAGKPYSSFLGQQKPRSFSHQLYAIEWPREALYARINQRCDAMLAQGLLKEVQGLLPCQQLSACQTVGYREFFCYFNGLCSEAEAIAKFKQHSRNYAKRQITWFRKQPGIEWVGATAKNGL